MMHKNDHDGEHGEKPGHRGPLTDTLDILNQRWTLHILRELLSGKKRFNEVARSLGVNACTLRDRLRMLERRGIVHREVVSAFPPNVEYSLTEKGMALHDIFLTIEAWGNRWLSGEAPAKAVRVSPGRKATKSAGKVSS